MKDLNDRDMAQKVEILKDINIKPGNETSEINTAMDGQYNSATTRAVRSLDRMHLKWLGLHMKLWQTKILWFRPASKISCVWLEPGSREKELMCSVQVDISTFLRVWHGTLKRKSACASRNAYKVCNNRWRLEICVGIDHAMKSFHHQLAD